MIINKKSFPDFIEITNLEKISKKDGSGISYEELIGVWKFQSVWKKGSNEIDNISSIILQLLSATLELSKKTSEKSQNNFQIKNSINFGILAIVFCGNGFLKGNIPLLSFYFEKLKINIGNFTLINKSLKKPQANKIPFFSLIAINKRENWMCARGRGGGLAIWIRS